MAATSNARNRLDHELVRRGLVTSRSQADSWIKLGKVTVDGRVVTKSGTMVTEGANISLQSTERYVSRAGLKLASVAEILGVDFAGKTVLDVGSSTGGFTDYALQHGAKRVFAVDVGTEQLHPSLRGDERIELHEKTDIREVEIRDKRQELRAGAVYIERPDIVLIDVSFISLRDILPHVSRLLTPNSAVIAMVKPQFEAGRTQTNKGVVKNEAVRRRILADFETWVRNVFVVSNKRDSDVSGAKGNRERFYLLRLAK